MIDYLAQYGTWYKSLFDFKAKPSADLCLSYLHDKILKGIYHGLLTGMILGP